MVCEKFNLYYKLSHSVNVLSALSFVLTLHTCN